MSLEHLQASKRVRWGFIGAGDVNEIAFEMLKRRDVISSRLRAIKPQEVAA